LGKTVQHILIGCSKEQMRRHIISLWEPEMSWENYGANSHDKKDGI